MVHADQMDQFSEELINKTIEYFESKRRPIKKEDAVEFLSSLADLAGLVWRVFPSGESNPRSAGVAPLT